MAISRVKLMSDESVTKKASTAALAPNRLGTASLESIKQMLYQKEDI